MNIKIKKDIDEKRAITAIDDLISDGNALISSSDYKFSKKITNWKINLDFKIEELFSNHVYILSILYSKGSFETYSSSVLTVMGVVNPVTADRINNKILSFQILTLNEIKEQIANEIYSGENKKESGNEVKINSPKKIKKELDKISSIAVVNKNKRNYFRIVINKNYSESFEVIESTSKNIKSLLNAIIDGTDVLKNNDAFEACKDYLNSNSGCRIYKDRSGKKQLYAITPIVKFKNGLISNKELEILPNIKTEVISFTTYNRLLSKQKDRNKN